MSVQVPTVRVKHPITGAMMTINAADLADHHELWPLQADDHDPTAVERARKRPMDPALRDRLAALGAKITSFYVEQEGGNYQAQSDVERLATVERFDQVMDMEVERYRVFKRQVDENRREDLDGDELKDVSQGPLTQAYDVVPDVTPPAPQVSEPEPQGDVTQPPDTSGETEVVHQQDPGQADDQDDQDEPGDSEDVPSDTHTLGVEESARGKFYVTRGGKRVSRGFPTSEEAERTRANMEAAS